MTDDSSSFFLEEKEEEEEQIEQEETVEVPEDFRALQIEELEQLQKTLDENNVLRATIQALQIQVPSLEKVVEVPPEPLEPGVVITPEEAEELRKQLEQTLIEYRNETNQATKLNEELDKGYTHLADLKMKMRLLQDERIMRQNQISTNGMTSFRAKVQKCKDSWNAERDRLNKAIASLKTVHTTALADIRELREQMRTNNKGIQHLSSSITLAREDIKDFTEQQQKVGPLLREFEDVQAKHQETEVAVVQLSDQLDALRNQVETSSLTAEVKRKLDSKNKEIADLNRSIDQIQCKTGAVQESIKDIQHAIEEVENERNRTTAEAEHLVSLVEKLREQREQIKRNLRVCMEAGESAGGDNFKLERQIDSGLDFEPEAPWTVRTQMLSIKKDLQKLDEIEEQKSDYEKTLEGERVTPIFTPQRKRVPMIPLRRH